MKSLPPRPQPDDGGVGVGAGFEFEGVELDGVGHAEAGVKRRRL